jgi:hypothetical protein
MQGRADGGHERLGLERLAENPPRRRQRPRIQALIGEARVQL